ncbi:unnamed protein product [Rotaria sordida]|uniref:Uncharacterized protein n=1 Tax=Rotaria sordida TaxID=392033 RepID=A0A813TNT8_9BILA|nr:unnamed protein product [Rotaria sordida]CAF3707639.1 unnamed protein product [Rotaria sordida]
MAETMTSTFNSLDTNSKETYKKSKKNVHSDISTMSSSKNSVNSSTNNRNDWQRLLLTRFKPGVTGKYRMTRKNGIKSDIISSTSFDDSTVILRSYNCELSINDKSDIVITQSDKLNQLDSSIENSIRRDNHFVKNSTSNRSDNHMTSLKRRVRKQQMRYLQNQTTFIQDTTFQLSSSTDLLLIPYSERSRSLHRYRSKKKSCIVPLPSLMNSTRVTPTYIRDSKLNLYGY